MTPRPWMTVRRLSLPDLLRHLGGIAPERVCFDPPPGTATEEYVDSYDIHHDRLFELIDGVLVEKVYNARNSLLGMRIGCRLGNWNDPREYGAISGAAGPFKFGPRQVRMPDVAITSWERLPHGIPRRPVPDLVPNVAVEVVNPANTSGEMARKLTDYRAAGVELIWYVYPDRREVEVFTGRGALLNPSGG